MQNNLIPRIENVGRLKELQYLNLALNNIETIENLQGKYRFAPRIFIASAAVHFKGCEFLEKLDFTVNFIGDLLSVEQLRCNRHLRELYLTGNPCTEYEGYRDFVVGTLPQLEMLDGKQITKSERIEACQQLSGLRCQILLQQDQHALKRQKEKDDFKAKQQSKEARKPGFDGRWYTDPQAHVAQEAAEGRAKASGVKGDKDQEEAEAYTPEYRLQTYREDLQRKQQESKEPE